MSENQGLLGLGPFIFAEHRRDARARNGEYFVPIVEMSTGAEIEVKATSPGEAEAVAGVIALIPRMAAFMARQLEGENLSQADKAEASLIVLALNVAGSTD